MTEINNALNFIKDNEVLVIEYEKDKRELFDKVPQFKVDKSDLDKKQTTLVKEQKIEQDKFNANYGKQKALVENIKTNIDEFDKDLEKFNTFKLSETYSSIQDISAGNIKDYINSKTAISIIEELNDKHFSGIGKFKDLQQSTNTFIGNFNENNIFKFKVKLNCDSDYLDFAVELKEFIEEDKINEFEKRVNERFAHIIQQIGNETTDLISKEAEIEKIIKKINDNFKAASPNSIALVTS